MDGVYFVESVLKEFKKLKSTFIDEEKTTKKLNDILSKMSEDGLEIRSIVPVTDTHNGMLGHANCIYTKGFMVHYYSMSA
tara:strand:- start:7219 stop:7458 length:240 start_codon:yes stop_codon:yes gene_type:complete